MLNTKSILTTAIASSLLLLSACSDNDDGFPQTPTPTPPAPAPVTFQYEVSVTNLTNAQPMSPVAVLLHNEGRIWTTGEPASVALETIAEGGNNSQILALDVALAAKSGESPLAPGASQTMTISNLQTAPQRLSIVTMLVNTNDAFTGLNAYDVSNMAVNESISLRVGSYDSGTERNSERANTMPGPVSGGAGEGFNAERDDINIVTRHPGIVSQDDGLMTSELTQAHRWDDPTMNITIKRLQ